MMGLLMLLLLADDEHVEGLQYNFMAFDANELHIAIAER
jgi:hypothetical protein